MAGRILYLDHIRRILKEQHGVLETEKITKLIEDRSKDHKRLKTGNICPFSIVSGLYLAACCYLLYNVGVKGAFTPCGSYHYRGQMHNIREYKKW